MSPRRPYQPQQSALDLGPHHRNRRNHRPPRAADSRSYPNAHFTGRDARENRDLALRTNEHPPNSTYYPHGPSGHFTSPPSHPNYSHAPSYPPQGFPACSDEAHQQYQQYVHAWSTAAHANLYQQNVAYLYPPSQQHQPPHDNRYPLNQSDHPSYQFNYRDAYNPGPQRSAEFHEAYQHHGNFDFYQHHREAPTRDGYNPAAPSLSSDPSPRSSAPGRGDGYPVYRSAQGSYPDSDPYRRNVRVEPHRQYRAAAHNDSDDRRAARPTPSSPPKSLSSPTAPRPLSPMGHAPINFRRLGELVGTTPSSTSSFRRLLLLLDLHGVLVDRISSQDKPALNLARDHRPVWRRMRYHHVWLRPHAGAFLWHATRRHTVSIWSAAQRRNVAPLVEAISDSVAFNPSLRTRLHAIWDRGACRSDPATGPYAVLKFLPDLWRSRVFEGFSDRDTIIVDDTMSKIRHNSENAVVVPEYNIHVTGGLYNHDDQLLWLLLYLEYITEESNMRQDGPGIGATLPNLIPFDRFVEYARKDAFMLADEKQRRDLKSLAYVFLPELEGDISLPKNPPEHAQQPGLKSSHEASDDATVQGEERETTSLSADVVVESTEPISAESPRTEKPELEETSTASARADK